MGKNLSYTLGALQLRRRGIPPRMTFEEQLLTTADLQLPAGGDAPREVFVVQLLCKGDMHPNMMLQASQQSEDRHSNPA